MISDLLDGNLSPGQKRKLEKHLATCKSCQAHCEALSLIQQEAKALRGPDFLPEQKREFERRLRASFEQSGAKKGKTKERPKLFLARPAWAAGGILLLVVILSLIFLWDRRPPEMQLAMMLSYEDSYLSLSQVIEEDESVAQSFNQELINSIDLEIRMEEELEGQDLQDIYEQEEAQYTENNLLKEKFPLKEGL